MRLMTTVTRVWHVAFLPHLANRVFPPITGDFLSYILLSGNSAACISVQSIGLDVGRKVSRSFMRYATISVNELPVGATIGAPVHDSRQVKLLAAGAEITNQLLDSLRQRS